MKLPAIMFYPGDWRKDPGVQALGYHDRGIWFEILCLMSESCERGKLLLNGSPMPDDALARILGLDKQNLTTTLTTLLTFGVASRCPETGALICRRMLRDEEIRKVRAESGKKGGNPRLLNHTANQNPTTQVNQNPTPSVSASTSFSTSVEEPHAAHGTPSQPSAKPKKPKPSPNDESWLAELAADPTYAGIDIRLELGKANRWCEVNRKPLSPRRFVSWLNRVEKPINHANHDSRPQPLRLL